MVLLDYRSQCCYKKCLVYSRVWTTGACAALIKSGLQESVLHLDVSGLNEPVLLLNISVKMSILLLDMSGLQEPALL